MNQTSFTKFEDLKPFENNQNFLLKLREVSDPIIEDQYSNESKSKALNDLRRLHKFHCSFFNQIFDNIIKDFRYILRSNELDLVGEALTLLYEVFDHHITYHQDIGDWVKKLVPELLDVLLDNTEFNDLIQKTLLNITKYLIIPETIEIFLEEIYDSKSEGLMQNAFNYLMHSIDTFSTTDLENNLYWDRCMDLICDIYHDGGERKNFITKAVIFIREKLGRGKLSQITDNYLKPELKDKVVCVLNEIDQSRNN
jgi:hypothetical protein